MDLDPMLTVDGVQEQLLTLAPAIPTGWTRTRAWPTSTGRLLHVQGRHLAAAADVDNAWRTPADRDVLLSRQLLFDVVRNRDRLTTATIEPDLLARARDARALLAG